MTETFTNFTSGEPPITETLVRMHNELGWLKDFIRVNGDMRDRPPRDEDIDAVAEYIERATARLSPPPPSTPAVGSL